MPRGDASRAWLAMLTLLLAVGMVAGAAAAPGDRDRKIVKEREGEEGGAEQTVAEGNGIQQDTDGDYLPDFVDNCPDVPNPDQADADGDGFGNACQPIYDSDGDGVPDGQDNCLLASNRSQADNDRDGIGNACDKTANGEPPPEPEPELGAGETADEDDGTAEEDADEAADGAAQEQGNGEQRAPTGDVATEVVAPPPPALRPFEPPAPALARPAPALAPPPADFDLPPAEFEVIARIDAGDLPARAATGWMAGDGAAELPAVVAYRQSDDDIEPGDGLPVPVEADAVIDLIEDDAAPPAGLDDREPLDGGLSLDQREPLDGGVSLDDREPLDEAIDGAEGWDRDAHFDGGLARARPAVTEIAGTDDDALYLSQRRGDARGRPGTFSYAIPVPEDGNYRVRLHFAEIYWGATGGRSGGAGKRVFSVDAEGEPVLVDYDINDDVGPMTAVVKQFMVDVEDGVLDLRFYGRRDQPMVAAIEVLGAPTGERWVDVNKSTRTVSLMIGGTVVARYQASMSVGPEDNYQDTMPGTYAIQTKVAELTWTPYARGYFMYWAGFDPPRENGFHSWVMDEQGRVVAGGDGPTWGCVATAPEDAAEIYAFVEIGTRVEVHW